MDRPIGIYLLMWQPCWAFLISSNGHPNVFLLILFLIGTVLTRSAGCVINDYFDKELDKKVERTKDRMLASGKVSSIEAVILFFLISLCILILMMIRVRGFMHMLNHAFCLIIIYPISKRYLKIPQMVLGIAFGSSIPMVYIAQTGQTNLSCLLLYVATISWAIAYDTYYAIADKKMI